MSTPSHRSHHGCWTCKSKRRKCDRARPTCQACNNRGLICEGYDVRLRWGTGIASRGRFAGADLPVESAVPARAKGRRRDRSRERRLQSAIQPSSSEDASPSFTNESAEDFESCKRNSGKRSYDEQLFQEFLSHGIDILHSTSVHDESNLLKPHLPRLCQQSEALYLICVTIQTSLTEGLDRRFFEYFDAALSKFRNELARSETYLEDGTMTAGLLLCSIGVMHGIPWTMHLQGMHAILHFNGVGNAQNVKTPFRAHLFEVMGVMDLPTFAIGRQHPHLGFWRRHCRNRVSTEGSSGGDEVEVVSGLPKSLVDLFSCIGVGGITEEDFWDWPGAQGNFLQCQLWEAYRLAGMLANRHGQVHFPLSWVEGVLQPRDGEKQRHRPLPSTAVIVSRIFSCVDAIHRASEEPEGRDTLIMNAVPYPVFIAGLQTEVMNNDPALKPLVRSNLLLNSNGSVRGKQCKLELELLEEYWRYSSGTVSIHQLAQARGIELGLF